MERGNHVWRYAIRRGDDDPARAAFVEQVEARLRAESTGLRRREAARRGREAFLERLRAEGRDVGQYFAQLARKSNAARRARRNIAPGPQQAEAAERRADLGQSPTGHLPGHTVPHQAIAQSPRIYGALQTRSPYSNARLGLPSRSTCNATRGSPAASHNVRPGVPADVMSSAARTFPAAS
jgi:hypothetical protein